MCKQANLFYQVTIFRYRIRRIFSPHSQIQSEDEYSCQIQNHTKLMFSINTQNSSLKLQLHYKIILVSDIHHSDSVFLQIRLHQSYYKIMAIFPCAVQYIIYFIHTSLYLLIPYTILLSLFPLSTGNHQLLSVSMFLFYK